MPCHRDDNYAGGGGGWDEEEDEEEEDEDEPLVLSKMLEGHDIFGAGYQLRHLVRHWCACLSCTRIWF